MAMVANDGSVAPSVIYQEVKAWIAQQEAYEAQHRRPAPLTDVQHKALQALRLPTTMSPSPPPPAAVAGGTNYVGVLMEHYQKRQQLDSVHWVEEASGVLPGGVTGRVCRVTIVDSLAHESGHIEHFPATGYGLDDDGSEQRFTSKKAAKHFAAKCAVEWLVAQGLMIPPAPSSQVASPPSSARQTPLPAAPSLKRTVPVTNGTTSPPPPKRQTVTAPMGVDGTSEAAIGSPPSPPATELVTNLCRELNFVAPRYDVRETAPGSQVYNGRAMFEDYGDPEIISLAEAGTVRSMAGKDATKKAVAVKVLKRLREIEAGRDAQLQLLRARLDNDV